MTTRRLATHVLALIATIVVLTLLGSGPSHTPVVLAQSLVQVEPWKGAACVQLEPLDEDGAALYAAHFRSANGRSLRPFALGLANVTEQNIIAVTLHWTIKSTAGPGVIIQRLQGQSTGGIRNWAQRTERNANGYMALRDVHGGIGTGLLPGERIMVAPGFHASSRGFGFGMSDFFDGRSATVRIDVVVFENGLVMGPDKDKTLDAMRARKAAMDHLLGAITEAEAKGQDPTAAIRALAAPRPWRSQRDDVNILPMLAMELLRTPNMAGQVQAWRALKLPDFHR